MSTIDRILGKYKAEIETTIQEILSDNSPDFMRGVIGYHLGWLDAVFQPTPVRGGKMFRPTITLLVFEALTGGHQKALPAAAAIEMIHNFSLLHDDIEDNDVERRGRPTAWTIWGQPRIINVGDFLYALAFQSLYRLEFPPEKIVQVGQILAETCLELTKGQEMDLRFESQPVVTTDMYLDMVDKKTGALIEAAITIGASLGSSDKTVIRHYRDFAHHIGIAFQIQDDILGIWGDQAQTGKSTATDLRRKKKTLPVIYTLAQPAPCQQQLLDYYSQSAPLSDSQIELMRENLAQTGAYQYAQEIAKNYRQKAFQALDQIDIANQSQTELERLAKFLVDRSH